MLVGGAVVERGFLKTYLRETMSPKPYLFSIKNSDKCGRELSVRKYLYFYRAPGILDVEFLCQNYMECPVYWVVLSGLKNIEVHHMKDPSLLNSWLDGQNEKLGLTSECELINYRRFNIAGTYSTYPLRKMENERYINTIHLASVMTPIEHSAPEEFLVKLGREIKELVANQEKFTSPDFLLETYRPIAIA